MLLYCVPSAVAKNPKESLITTLKDDLGPVFGTLGVDFAYLVGSWAQNTHGWWSDVDLFVSWPKFRDDSRALLRINEQVWENTDVDKINVQIVENLPIHVQYTALSEGILLYARTPSVASTYLENLMGVYFDHIIWYKRYLKESVNSHPKTKGGPIPPHKSVLTGNSRSFLAIILGAMHDRLITLVDVSKYLGVSLKHLEKIQEAVSPTRPT